LQGNGVGASASVAAPAATLAVNKWIIGEVVETLAKLDRAIADLRYDAMADAIYHFAWGTFCDWYIELIKPTLQVAQLADADGKGPGALETKAVASWAFDQILVMLHPFMPFITEELWYAMGKRSDGLIHAAWPRLQANIDEDAKHEVDWLIGILQNVRSIRAELSIAPGLKIIIGTDHSNLSDPACENLKALFVRYGATLARIGKIESFVFFNTGIRVHLESGQMEDRTEERHTVPGSGRPFGVSGVDYIFGLEGAIDLDAERARLTKGIETAEKEAASVASRLNNPAFVEKAKPEAIAKARADHAEKSAEAERLRAALARLG
jgi:valyl-tRNA synthetase